MAGKTEARQRRDTWWRWFPCKKAFVTTRNVLKYGFCVMQGEKR